MAKALYPLVEIEWTDAFSPRDKAWYEECELDTVMAAVAVPDRACGYIVRDTPAGILLAGQLTSGSQFGDLFFIPRGMVRRKRVLREAAAHVE